MITVRLRIRRYLVQHVTLSIRRDAQSVLFTRNGLYASDKTRLIIKYAE